MKNLIITMGAIILILSISGLQLQCNSMFQEKRQIKFAADEGASTVALFIDEEAYGEGDLIFDRKKGEQTANEIIKLNMKTKDYHVSYMYYDTNGDNPSVQVTITKGGIKATSKYEYL